MDVCKSFVDCGHVMPETGNKNVFTTFKGKFAMEMADGQTSSNETVMLSCVNDVQFLGNVTLSGYLLGEPFATLPEECRPKSIVVFMAYLVTTGTDHIVPVQCSSSGWMSLAEDVESGTLYLNGLSFQISDCWY